MKSEKWKIISCTICNLHFIIFHYSFSAFTFSECKITTFPQHTKSSFVWIFFRSVVIFLYFLSKTIISKYHPLKSM